MLGVAPAHRAPLRDPRWVEACEVPRVTGFMESDDARCTFDFVPDDHAAAADDLRGRRCIYSVAAGMAGAV